MHWQDAKAHGEQDARLYLLNAWSEASVYTPRERAALAWTEALTRIETSQASDADYAETAAHFAPREQVALRPADRCHQHLEPHCDRISHAACSARGGGSCVTTTSEHQQTEDFLSLRPRLFAVAYRMFGHGA